MRMNCFEKSDERHGEIIICLAFDERKKSRGKAISREGQVVAWFLQRGESLRQGDVLKTDCGHFVQIVAAAEPVSKGTTDDPFLLTRAAYHLGNRHVPIQVEPMSLLYQSDHVLDDMLRGLGLSVEKVDSVFQPEDGAYHNHGN